MSCEIFFIPKKGLDSKFRKKCEKRFVLWQSSQDYAELEKSCAKEIDTPEKMMTEIYQSILRTMCPPIDVVKSFNLKLVNVFYFLNLFVVLLSHHTYTTIYQNPSWFLSIVSNQTKIEDGVKCVYVCLKSFFFQTTKKRNNQIHLLTLNIPKKSLLN